MPISEKEFNCNLLDQLELLERIERVAKDTNNNEKILEEIAYERKFIERKLYEEPLLRSGNS